MIALLGAALALALLFFGLEWLEKQGRKPETRGDLSARYADQTVTLNGKACRRRQSLTSILLLGIDRPAGNTDETDFQSGGNADFLRLLVIDSENKTISQIQIDRDTIAPVTTLNLIGQRTDTRLMQIALSHSYGKTPQDNCNYTIQTVSNLLQGEPLDLYFSLNMASVAKFNDLLGGVTVTMQEDHTLINPAFTKGATIRLMGKDAYDYVHSRMYVDDGTNTSRMARQRNYMLAAKDTLISRLAHDSAFVDTLFETLGSDLVTNVTRGRLINEAAKASQYGVGEITQMVGEHVIGNNGFMEFHADEQFLIDWVLSVFYKEYK